MTRLLHYSYLGACWVALAGFGAANPTFHSVPAVPAWARDAVGPRSPPSEEVYTLAVEAWRALAARQPPIDDESASEQRFSTEQIEAMRQMVRLKELGATAWTWMYFDDRLGSGDRRDQAHLRERLLKTLELDPEAAPLLVSMARARVVSLVESLERGALTTEILIELYALISYLEHQGRASDIEPLKRLIPLYPDKHLMRPHVERLTDDVHQRAAFESVGAFTRTHSQALWRGWANVLIRNGYDTEESLGLVGAGQGKEMAAPPIQQAPAPVPKDGAVKSGAAASLAQWAVCVALAGAVSAVVFLVVSRRHKQRS